jgi:hypothetical protein
MLATLKLYLPREQGRFTVPLTLLFLTLLAAWPLFRHGPSTLGDGPNHFYRLVELSWLIRQGDLYPRWFSDINYGFGGPLFKFYAPLSYYIAVPLFFAGLSWPSAYLWASVLAVGVGVVGMYLWAKDQFNSPLAGVVASAAYQMSPYMYFNVLIRGAYPEMWALALAPWMFWSARRLILCPGRVERLLFILLYLALMLTHNLSSLFFTPLFVLYVIVLILDAPSQHNRLRWRLLAPFAGGLLLAIGLTAFYLLPFSLEIGYVNLQRARFDFRDFFVPLKDLLSLPVAFDPYLANPPYPISLSLAELALAVVALIMALTLRHRFPHSRLVVAQFAALAITAFLTHSASVAIWQLLPLGRLLQFPWRLLGPVSLLLAWLVAAVPLAHHLRWALGVIAVIFFYSLTWTYRHPADAPFPDARLPTDVIGYELKAPAAVGLTYQKEFVPRWVSELPPPESLLARYADDLTPSRLEPLPAFVTVLSQESRINTFDVVYSSPDPFDAVFDIFYFPGWAATLNGQPLPIQATPSTGLIAVHLPAGQNTLHLALEPTSPQMAGGLISLASLLLLAVFVYRSAPANFAPASFAPASLAPASLAPASALPSASISWPMPLMLLGFICLRVLVLDSDRIETPFYRTEFRTVRGSLSDGVQFGDQLALIGLDFPEGRSFAADQTIPIDLYWQALTPLIKDYHVSIQLVDGRGNRFGHSDQYPGLYPTGGWRKGMYIRDDRALLPFAGAPPGDYHLRVSVYSLEKNTVSPLNLILEGQPAGLEYDLGVVTLTPGWRQPPGLLRVAEASVAGDTFSVGDLLPFTMTWHSGSERPPGLEARLSLTDAAGRTIFSSRFPPIGPNDSPELWTPDVLLQYPHSILLPPDLPPGPARVAVDFVASDGATLSDPFLMGEVRLVAPSRSFDIPPMAHRVDHDFREAVRLLGYNVMPDAITLYWQSLQPVSTRLTVFIHRFDAAGEFVGGDDSPPPRSTTSWLPGEVLVDSRPVAVGDRFEIGLYDPITGERFGEPFVVQH